MCIDGCTARKVHRTKAYAATAATGRLGSGSVGRAVIRHERATLEVSPVSGHRKNPRPHLVALRCPIPALLR